MLQLLLLFGCAVGTATAVSLALAGVAKLLLVIVTTVAADVAADVAAHVAAVEFLSRHHRVRH